MKRILLRSPKNPFEVVSPRMAYERNLIGDNSGNLVFMHAAHKILATSEATIDHGGFSVAPRLAGSVNERYDVYVMPMANAFRPSYEPKLKRITRFIEGLKIPVVILGVGAQSSTSYELDRLKPMEATVRRFVTAVLNRAPSIGVRGELTETYLRSLGFRDVEVIGCPSMFLHGDRLPVEKRLPALDRTARVSINVSTYVTAMGPVVMSHLERYPNLTYIAQDLTSLGLLLRGEDRGSDTARDDPLPVHVGHPFFTQQRIRFYVEPWPWMNDLARSDFSFGTRIHGNITALLAGTPAYVLAHDSRTLELARYFEIPHRLMSKVNADTDAAQLYEEADYSLMISGHSARFATFVDYLGRHGLQHVFTEGEDPAAFDRRVAATRFPPAVTASRGGTMPGGLAGRWLRARHRLAVHAEERREQIGAGIRLTRKRLGRLRRKLR